MTGKRSSSSRRKQNKRNLGENILNNSTTSIENIDDSSQKVTNHLFAPFYNQTYIRINSMMKGKEDLSSHNDVFLFLFLSPLDLVDK